MKVRVVVVGDVLLDRDWPGEPTGLCPDSFGPVVRLDGERTRPGGAALTATAVAALGAPVTLVTAIGDDPAGDLVRSHLAEAGVRVIDLGSEGPTPEKIRVRHAGVTVARLDRGCAPARPGRWDASATAAMLGADAVLLSDYGRGLVHHPGLAGALARGTAPPVVWDPHRSSRLPDGAPVVLATPSEGEARHLARAADADPHTVAASLAASWSCAVAMTRGAAPVTLATDARTVVDVACEPVAGDPCGAGDWFAAGATVAIGAGDDLLTAVDAGCRAAGRWVAGADRPGGRVVATSGCFDVLHAGHVALLRHARSLGDRLVVLLNSDDSVRRLKGHGRPVNCQEERRSVLAALADVDEVRIFDELTPCAALEQLRPDVFVKGEDYLHADLPERHVLAAWGGCVAFAPLVPDRSTTRVIELASRLTG